MGTAGREFHETLQDGRRGARFNIDLSALRTLKLVHEVGSISLAARRLDVDQSAISYTIKRLRKAFDDPLFTRSTSGLVATDRCQQIVTGIDDILDRFDRMTRPRSFDPARDEFEVVIGLSHAGLAVLMTPLVRRLRQIAPRARLRFIQSRASAYEALEAGSCDLLIRPMPYENLPFRHRFLMRDRFVCLVDRDGPHARNGLTLESYAAARHILISFEGLYRPPWFDRMNEMGMPQQIALDLSSTSEIEEFLIGTDLVATVTEELAHLCSDRVALIPAPIHAHQDIYMFWSERTQERENMQWFRNLVAEMASQISSRLRATPDRDRGERDGGC